MAPGDTGGAEVGSFQRIDGNVDGGHGGRIGELCAHLLADIKHRGLVALAFANDHDAVHRHGIHSLAHCLRSHLVAQTAVALPHGLGRRNGCILHYPKKLQRQVALQVHSITLGFRHYACLHIGSHVSSLLWDAGSGLRGSLFPNRAPNRGPRPGKDNCGSCLLG